MSHWVVLLLVFCACGTAKKTVPTVDSFTANPESVPEGGTSTLHWDAEDFAKCTLASTQAPNFSVTAAVPSGSKVVTLGQISTVYILTCTQKPDKPGGSVPAPTVATAYVSVQ